MEEVSAHLLCLLQRSELTPSAIVEAKVLAGRIGEEWTFFFDLAERNSAYILTRKRLNALSIGPKNRERSDLFQTKSDLYEGQSLARASHISEILKKAQDAKLEAILLKGALLGPTLYQYDAYKKMNDVDLLFSFEDAKKFADILRSSGFSSVGHMFGDNEFSADNHHCPPFFSPDLKCLVGIHWGLSSPHSRWKIDLDSIWRNKVAIEAYGTECFRMSWEETLLHLCIHLPFFKIGCRELADVYNVVLSSEPKVDWNRFANLVSTWQAQDAAYRVLTLAQALIPFSIPDSLLKTWRNRSSRFTQKDTEKRVALGFLLIATRSTQIAKIEKAFALFRISGNYLEKISSWAMTWKLTFWPKQKELGALLAMLEPVSGFRASLLARIQVLTYCWRAMARDYGNTALIFITLQNVGIIVKETLFFPFKKNKTPIRVHPIFKLMEMLE